jgi:hypothetical protein
MTDQETAKAIGNLILKQRVKISAMTTELNYNFGVQWQSKVDATIAELQEVAQDAYEFSTLLQVIDSQDDCTSLLRILHQYIANGAVSFPLQ